jgi:signal transduction histidine kinase
MNLNLINDLLDLAKIEQCKFSLVQEYFNMETVINNAFKNVRFLADQKNIKLLLEYDETPEGPANLSLSYRKFTSQKDLWQNRMIYGDQRRYLQILLNFISNALKFTNKNGTIKVRLYLLEYQKDIKRRNSCDDLEEIDEKSSESSFKQSARDIPRSNTFASIGKKDSLETKIEKKESNANI